MTGGEMENKQQWVCSKCGGREADMGVIRTTGGGASRYFNIQNHKFEYLSCKRCGYTDLFRPSDQGGGGVPFSTSSPTEASGESLRLSKERFDG